MIKKRVVRIQQIGTPNKNKCIYLRDVIEKDVVQKEVELKKIEMPILGEVILGAPLHNTKLNYNKVSHVVENLRIEKDWLLGDLTTLNLPDGKILEKIFEEIEPELYIRSAGEVIKPLLNGCFQVAELDLVAIDVLIAKN